MPFGLVISLACHAALLGWAFLSMRAAESLPTPDTPSISAELITPSEFLRLKQGSEDAKNLETKANDKPTEDDSKNDEKKPENAPPPQPSEPPPQDVAKVEEPPPPEPPESEPPPEPAKAEPPPEPPPGPTPDEQKLLEQKILDEQRAAEDAKRKAEEEAKRKAEEEAKKKAEDEAKKKAEEARKKKLAEQARKKKADEARKKAEAEKKKFDPSKIASLLDKAPDDGTPKALLDKDPRKKGQQATGSSKTALATGREAGTATGTDTVLSAREQDLLKGMIKSQLAACWRLPGAGGGEDTPVVTLRWRMKPDGSLDGDPAVQSAPGDSAGQVAAEAALRAVRGCQPFRLPAEQYDGWKDVIWVFDPRQML